MICIKNRFIYAKIRANSQQKHKANSFIYVGLSVNCCFAEFILFMLRYLEVSNSCSLIDKHFYIAYRA
jgi:hypothetical protein